MLLITGAKRLDRYNQEWLHKINRSQTLKLCVNWSSQSNMAKNRFRTRNNRKSILMKRAEEEE